MSVACTKNREEELGVLRKLLIATFGRKVTTARDCQLLADEIFAKTTFRVSANTLRRLFKIVKATYLPSKSTLNILSQYCGFSSFEELLLLNNGTPAATPQAPFTQSTLNFLISLFKELPARHYHDETLLALVKPTVKFLTQNTELAEAFNHAVAKIPNGQIFYFEQYVNIDGLNSHYGSGLRMYLMEKKEPEAQIFAHSLLGLRAWLSNDVMSLEKHYNAVAGYQLNASIHPFVCGRYFALQLFHAHLQKTSIEKILKEMYAIHGSIKQHKNNGDRFPGFEYAISIALVLTGHFEQVVYFTNYAIENYPVNEATDDGYYKFLHLLKAWGLLHTGNRNAALFIFNNIQPSSFYFLSKKTATIFYLALAGWLKVNKIDWKSQAEELVQELGYWNMRLIFPPHRADQVVQEKDKQNKNEQI